MQVLNVLHVAHWKSRTQKNRHKFTIWGTMAQLCQPISSQLTARSIWEVGVAGSPVIGRRRGAFSTLLRRPGLRASSDGILATKSERKTLASTCLYSLCAWFNKVNRISQSENSSSLLTNLTQAISESTKTDLCHTVSCE